jgi:mono/diheme cytochrome c family protein
MGLYSKWAVRCLSALSISFFASPSEFAATAITYDTELLVANCAVCHGAEGRSGGAATKSLATPVTPPAYLTATHRFAHSDGELHWYISHGIAARLMA